ncbi:hypothetical protein ACW95P_03340 [Candidatus Mycoplasma pogonae]
MILPALIAVFSLIQLGKEVEVWQIFLAALGLIVAVFGLVMLTFWLYNKETKK